MRPMLARQIQAALLTGVAFAAACAPADYLGSPLEGSDLGDGGLSPSGSCAPEPATTVPPLDPASLPACCDRGAARCVPESGVVPSLAGRLDPCAGGFCEP